MNFFPDFVGRALKKNLGLTYGNCCVTIIPEDKLFVAQRSMHWPWPVFREIFRVTKFGGISGGKKNYEILRNIVP